MLPKPKAKRKKPGPTRQTMRAVVCSFNKLPNHELAEAKFRHVTTITGAASTGLVNVFLNLATNLTGLPDWSDMVAVYKRVVIPRVVVRVTPNDINQKGVLAIGFNPDGASSLPGSFGKVAELKQFTECRAVDSVKTLVITNPNISANRMPYQLIDVGNIATLSAMQFYQDGFATNASQVLYYVTVTYQTFWAYRG